MPQESPDELLESGLAAHNVNNYQSIAIQLGSL